MVNKQQYALLTLIYISWLALSASVKSDLFLKLRLNQNNDLKAQDNNDELGGSLLDLISTDPEKKSNLFALPEPSPPDTLKEPVDLNKIVDQVNQEPPKNETVTPTPKNDTINEVDKLEEKVIVPNETKIEPKNETIKKAVIVPVPIVPIKRLEPQSVPQVIILYKNQTCNLTVPNGLHASFPIPETMNMKYYSLITVIIFGFTYLLIRGILALTKENSFFFSKALKIMANQALLYFICVVILLSLFVFGALDSIPINFEYLINGLAIFGVSWVLFCIVIILFCLLVVRKWVELETNAKDFKTVKSKYEKSVNKNYDPSEKNNRVDTSYFFELYEYLILKVYFCIPFYPIFKASTLRKDFNFSIYLKYCLLEKLRLFFKISWTCWVVTVFSIMAWSVFITTRDIKFITIFMLCYPIIGILTSLLIYWYLRIIYRRVVIEVNENNHMEFSDLEHFNQQYATGKFLNYPLYIDNVMKDSKMAQISKINLHEHFHHRSPSLFEDNMFFGASGFYILLNTLQAIGFVFIVWTVLLITKHLGAMLDVFGNSFLFLVIPIIAIYIAVYSFIISISLRWYTVISSVNITFNNSD